MQEQEQELCRVRLTTSDDGKELAVHVSKKSEALNISEMLNALIAIYLKAAEDHNVGPIEYFHDYLGLDIDHEEAGNLQ
jgi:hypothetical protein